MQILNELTHINKSSLALGFFDGLHQGHRVVLKNTINEGKKYNCPSLVIMFKNHPQNLLSNNKIEQILTFHEKLEMLEKFGIDYVVVLNFEDYQNMTALNYLENILVKYFAPCSITTGYNHYFGFNRQGDSEFLRKNSEKYNFKYFEIPPYVINGEVVSSSQIRNKLHYSDFSGASMLLGYMYFIQGCVIHGEHNASLLGFPSANIEYPKDKVKVPYGVYYVKVTVLNKQYDGVLNYGIIKSCTGDEKLKTEVHIIDFNKNIYAEKIKISFVTKIRTQKEFENTDKLKEQINRDIAFTQIYKHFIATEQNFTKN